MIPVALFLLDPSATAGADLTEVSARTPLLAATDLAATRGDGIFETIVVVHGRPQAVEAHLDRFARSARLLDLPEPDRDRWQAAVDTVAQRLAAHPRGAVRYVMSRGDEAGDGAPTCWLLGFLPPARPEGGPTPVRVVTLDRGYRSDVAATSPWLLQGAKTLSYAVNMAALREARRRGADDVVFVSTDGLILEGPSSTVISRRGDEFVTPPAELGILPGTTQHDCFSALRAAGRTTHIRALTPDDLISADALWLCSSTRGAAPISRLDDKEITVDTESTTLMNAGLDARRR